MGLRIFSWQGWLYTVCRSVRIERIDKRGIRSVRCAVRLSWFCACVGLWFIARVINITLGVRLSWFLRLCWFMIYRTRNITFGVCFSWFLRLCWFMVCRTRNITLGVRLSWFFSCACVGLWFIEPGIVCAERTVR